MGRAQSSTLFAILMIPPPGRCRDAPQPIESRSLALAIGQTAAEEERRNLSCSVSMSRIAVSPAAAMPTAALRLPIAIVSGFGSCRMPSWRNCMGPVRIPTCSTSAMRYQLAMASTSATEQMFPTAPLPLACALRTLMTAASCSVATSKSIPRSRTAVRANCFFWNKRSSEN